MSKLEIKITKVYLYNLVEVYYKNTKITHFKFKREKDSFGDTETVALKKAKNFIKNPTCGKLEGREALEYLLKLANQINQKPTPTKPTLEEIQKEEAKEKEKTTRQANALKKWAKELAYYTGEEETVCLKIAKDKLNYDGKMPSSIRDEDHADAIIIASERHLGTNYEKKLEEAKEKARNGEIEWSEVQTWARENKYEGSY